MSLDQLLQGPIARDVLRSYRRAQAEQRRLGHRTPEWAQDVVEALHRAAEMPLGSVMSAAGPDVGTLPSTFGSWGTCREGAELVDRTDRHVRRLAQSGQIRSRLGEGGVRMVDLDSLRQVIDKRKGR